MSTAAFDTLSAARELEAAGIKRRQAERMRRAASAARDEFATKADLAEMETRLRADTCADLAELETRLTWRLLAIAALIIAAVKLIPALD